MLLDDYMREAKRLEVEEAQRVELRRLEEEEREARETRRREQEEIRQGLWVIAQRHGVSVIEDLTRTEPDPSVLCLLERVTCERMNVLPLYYNDDDSRILPRVLVVAMSDVVWMALNALESVHVHGPIRPVIADAAQIRQAIHRLYGKSG
ncbi:MAG: hypothetical protein WCV84_02220 [Patescibacteria group bacterium]